MKQATLLKNNINEEMEYLYKNYESFMEGYSIFSTQSIFIPFYKVSFRVSYTATTEMNLLEEFICRVITMQIGEKDDILEVLSLDEEFFELAVSTMIKDGLLLKDDQNLYHLTEEGRVLYENKKKHEKREDTFSWYYDGLSDEFIMDYFTSDEEHRFLNFKDIDAENNLILPPKVIPEYQEDKDKERLENFIKGKIRREHRAMANKIPISFDEIVSVENFRLLPEKELVYHEFNLLLFTDGYSDYRLLAHDPCGKVGNDTRVTRILDELLKNDNLSADLKEVVDSLPTVEKVIQALKESMMEEETDLTEEEQEHHLRALELISSKPLTLKFLMDKGIRAKFLEALENAEKSLYINSPWMSNKVIDADFKNSIRTLLKRGVEIIIIYGMDGNRATDVDRMKRTEDLADELRRIGKAYGNQMRVVKSKTHEKIIIWDQKNLLLGSYNFLSYNAENYWDVRNEGCLYTDSEEIIAEIMELRFNKIINESQ